MGCISKRDEKRGVSEEGEREEGVEAAGKDLK